MVPSLAPVIIEHPSFDLVLWVTAFSAALTFVLLEALIPRQVGWNKRSGSNNYEDAANPTHTSRTET